MKYLSFVLMMFGVLNLSSQNFTIELESTTLEVESVAQGLEIPWDMVWGPDGKIWFSERKGNFKRLDPETGDVELLYFEEDCDPYEEENSGLHAFSLHPEFPEVPYIYAHYSSQLYISKLVKYTFDWNSSSITASEVLLQFGANSSHNGSRIVWDNNDSFFFCIGDAYTSLVFPQNPDELNGKILRIGMNGEIPADNPNPDSYVYSLGHRNPQGLVMGDNGLLYSTEHGTAVDDEVNIIYPGGNYGWPYSIGPCDVIDAEELEFCLAFDVVEPIWWWNPTQACAGMEYYNHEAIPEWSNSLIIGFLKEAQFKVLKLTADGLNVTEELPYLDNEIGRIRDILKAPDGSVYICTSDREVTGFPYLDPDDDQIYRIYNPEYTHIAEKRDKEALKVFPNPADTYSQLLLPDAGEWTLEVVDQTGRWIHSELLQGANAHEINTATWANGSYVVRLKELTGSRILNSRLVVNH